MKRIFILIFSGLLSGCTILGTYMDPLNPAPSYTVNHQIKHIQFINLTPSWVVNHNTTPTYRVGPYDILNVIVWDHSELTTPSTQMSSPGESGYLVSDQGTISYPFAGIVKVSGLTLPQIENKIEQRISKYIRNPQVTARVAIFRSQEAQILGEVGAQKTIPLTDKPTSLMDALNQAGGTSVMTANTSRIYVIRGNVDRLTVFKLNAKTPEMMMVAQRFNIKNNDIIYVSPLGVTNWNRVIGQLFPLFGTAVAVKAATQ